jgi:hypothetical protein
VTAPSAATDVDALAAEIDDRVRVLPAPSTGAIRRVRRDDSRRLRPVPAEQVLALALALVDRQRWVAYELVYFHPGGLACLDAGRVERLGRGMDGWARSTPSAASSPARRGGSGGSRTRPSGAGRRRRTGGGGGPPWYGWPPGSAGRSAPSSPPAASSRRPGRPWPRAG